MSTASETARRLAALSPEQREKLLARLREREPESPGAPEAPFIATGPVDRSAPVPLTDAQEAFWIGGSGLFDLGGSGGNVYLEHVVATDSVRRFVDDLNAGFARMIRRHEILRTVVLPDGTQRALPEVPPFQVEVRDLTAFPEEELERRLNEAREQMRYGQFRTDRWPLFEVVVHQVSDGWLRLHSRFHAVLMDGPTRTVMEEELAQLILHPDGELPPLDISFLDHARALAAFRDSPAYRRSRDYWAERLETLPPMPRLPLARDVGPRTAARIAKEIVELLPPETWQSLQQRTSRQGLNLTALLAAAFAETIAAWNGGPRLTLGVMGVYRPEDHPQIQRVIGNFNTLHLLRVEGDEAPFGQRAKLLHRRLLEDLDHQHYSGHQVMRDLRQRQGAGARALLPVLFDSVIEYGHDAPSEEEMPAAPIAGSAPAGEESAPAEAQGGPRIALTDLRISIPQVLFLCVMLERDNGGLDLIYQAAEDILPEGLVTEVVETYRRLLERLATEDAAWLDPSPVRLALPEPPGPASWELSPDDRLLAVPPDLARELAGNGKAVVPGPGELADPERLAALAAREKVTVWVSPPAVLEMALAAAERRGKGELASLRRVLLHGDRVPVSLPARLAALCPRARLDAAWGTPLAALGPLEATDFAAPAVGRLRVAPLPGRRLEVLSPSGRALPSWVEGDLHAGTGPPLLPTGGRGCHLPDGRVEIREPRDEALPESLGESVDPARIEAALERYPGVGSALVAWQAAGRGRLAAWIVPRGAARPDAEELRRHLLGLLPEHLVPEAFAFVERPPLTADGRIDRAALPPLPEPPAPRAAADFSGLETELAGLWEEVLGQRPASPEDDFRELGGDSLRAVLLMTRVVERYGLERPLASFLEFPTLGRLAELVDRERAEAARRAEEAAREERRPFRRLRESLAALGNRILPPPTSPERGLRIYLLLWFSQFVSGIGTGLGSFALGVWVYRQNASATQYSMMAFAATCTALLITPVAGVLADRWDRKRLILLGDSGAAMMTGLMALALYTGRLQLWHVYIIVVVMVGFGTLQGPALVASTSQLVPRRQLARMSGMAQAAGIATGIICPPLSAALVPVIDYHGVIMIDISTFLFAFVVILCIRLPRPAPTPAGAQRRSMWGDFRFGWNYIWQRPGLLSLLLLFAVTNFSLAIVQVLLTPLILSFGSAENLGAVSAASAAGGLLGSVALSVWGGPRNRVLGILLFLLLQAPILLLGGLQPNVALIALASFAFMALSPFVGGLSQAIWQSKVAHDIQGRVFGMRALIASSMAPLAFLLAGPLADRFFEPLMAPGGALAGTVGQLIGVGKGRGVGLLFMTLGLLIIVVTLLSSLNPRLRKVETELPDAQ